MGKKLNSLFKSSIPDKMQKNVKQMILTTLQIINQSSKERVKSSFLPEKQSMKNSRHFQLQTNPWEPFWIEASSNTQRLMQQQNIENL